MPLDSCNRPPTLPAVLLDCRLRRLPELPRQQWQVLHSPPDESRLSFQEGLENFAVHPYSVSQERMPSKTGNIALNRDNEQDVVSLPFVVSLDMKKMFYDNSKHERVCHLRKLIHVVVLCLKLQVLANQRLGSIAFRGRRHR